MKKKAAITISAKALGRIASAADPERVAFWYAWDSLVAEAERRISADHAAKTLTRRRTIE